MADVWNPEQYRRFAAERRLPFDELLAMICPGNLRRGVDLGCGPGELTAFAASELGIEELVGVDNSPAMLASAVAHTSDRVRFEHGDLATWTSAGEHDLVLAAASLQWVGDHPAVLARWAAALAPGGQLAVQMPANAHAASHMIAAELARREPYVSSFGPAGPPADPVAVNVLRPEQYAEILHELGFAEQFVQLRVYPHVLPRTRDVVEWVKGTTLTRFRAALPAELYERFLTEYERELVGALGDRSPFLFPFNRILFWARMPA